MKKFTKLYKEGLNKKDKDCIDFVKKCKDISKKAISEFLKKSKLDTRKLSKYLFDSQKEKNFILYNNDNFYYDKL